MANKQEASSFPAHPECAIRHMDKLKKRDRQGIMGFIELSEAGLLCPEDSSSSVRKLAPYGKSGIVTREHA